jgi:hypothetical protein
VGVVHVVVGVAPLVGGAGVVPLELLAGERRIVHPVVLAVHHVVADLHVVEDLGEREGGRARDPGRREDARPEQAAAGDLEPPLGADHLADVVGVALAAVGEDPPADRIQLLAEAFDLLRCEGDLAFGCGAHLVGLSWKLAQSVDWFKGR